MHKIFNYTGKITDRGQFGGLMRKLGMTKAAVEIGLHKGVFASKFMRDWRGDRYYLIDPYRKLSEEEYPDTINRNFDRHPDRMEKTLKLMRKIGGGKINFMRMRSAEAAPLINEELDFVHIDGNHTYAFCKQDIEIWWPKVRSGGILAGHDLFFPGEIDVTNAVIEFSLQTGLTINVVPQSMDNERRITQAASWWVVKP